MRMGQTHVRRTVTCMPSPTSPTGSGDVQDGPLQLAAPRQLHRGGRGPAGQRVRGGESSQCVAYYPPPATLPSP